MRYLVFLLFITALAPGIAKAGDQKWSRLTGCKWMENPSNDGDSFHVNYNGKEFIFRLYFVDACEDSEQVPQRVREQAKALGITPERVLAAGKAAQTFTHSLLAGQTFTVVTKWEDAKGASRLPRNYAFVFFGANDQKDLASTLAQNGFVRIYGMPADPPGAVTAEKFRRELLRLDAQARSRRLGIFENPTAGVSASMAGISSSSAASASSALLPANSHPPDVVDNPADEDMDVFAIKAVEAPMVIQSTISENDFSEIPGWKPKPK